jgi:hypothetical protein
VNDELFKALRDGGVVLSTRQVIGDEKDFIMAFAKWCIDRHLDHDEYLPDSLDIDFKDLPDNQTQIRML